MAILTERASYGTKLNKKPKTRRADYGDGYSQRVALGINNNPKMWSATWDKIPASRADAIMAIFDGARGVDSIQWTDPDGDTIKVLVTDYEKNELDDDEFIITAMLEQVFGE